jgi:hypothetical protein
MRELRDDDTGESGDDQRMADPEGMAWEAVHRDGVAAVPAGWTDLDGQERELFRDELSEWVSKAKAQPHLFADRSAPAARELELTEQRP